jgi:hypothetical protein
LVRKHWKRIVAIATAAVVLLAGIPGIPDTAFADTEDTTATESTTGTTDSTSDATETDGESTEENAQNVSEDGEVIMDGAVGKVDKSQWITKKDYEQVAESDSYIMYLYEPRLSIMLENKKTGEIIESTLSDEKDDGNSNSTWNAYMKSGLVISAIVGIKSDYQVDMVSSQNTIDVTKEDNGFSAKITFPEYGFGLTVNVTLEDDDLVVNIPDDSITESVDGTYISTITMFPFMGYSFLDDEEGYMLIPDGNGALINLDNKEGRYTTGFSQMIYGSDVGFRESDTKEYLWDELDMLQDANEVIAPIFGMAHTKEGTGYLAVVEKGEKRASIAADPNGVMVNYNRCYAKFLLRDVYVQPLNNSSSGSMQKAEDDRTHSDLQVRYMLLSGDDANYSEMATKYRNYLLDNNLISVKDNSYKTRVDFLGTDREEFLLGTRAVTMTKTEDIENIYNELQTAGVSSLLSVYKGWQKGGIYNVPITSYKADSHIGGTSDLTDLVSDAASKNYSLYLYADALRLNPSNHALNFNMIKRINKRTYEEEVWAEVYDSFYYLTPETSVEDFKDLAEDAVSDGVANLAVSGISNTIFSYSYKGDFYTRNDTAQAYSDVLDEVGQSADLILEEPSAYLWNNTSAFLDMPLGSSDYMYIDEEVPFLSMVLKGVIPMYSNYVNFEANKQEFYLQMIEAGVYPSFYVTEKDSSALIYTNSANLYSTAYSTYKDMIVEYDKDFRQFSQLVDGANITKHEKLDSGVTKVTYSNGTTVYVNYTDEAQTVDGISVEAMSYSYKAGEAE